MGVSGDVVLAIVVLSLTAFLRASSTIVFVSSEPLASNLVLASVSSFSFSTFTLARASLFLSLNKNGYR